MQFCRRLFVFSQLTSQPVPARPLRRLRLRDSRALPGAALSFLPCHHGAAMAEGDVAKLQRHLSLLREEYVKLQARYADVERKYNVAVAASGNAGSDSFVSRLLKTVAKWAASNDLTVQLNGKSVRAHKFVLSCRSQTWGVGNLADVDTLDLTDIQPDVGLPSEQV
ncbi:hypothetical protein MRX96_003745 [Rhipicephalus microplus]